MNGGNSNMFKPKRVISSIIVLAVLIMGISLNLNVMANKIADKPSKPVVYITKNSIKDFQVDSESGSVKTINPESVGNVTDDVNIWVDNDLINQKDVKEKLDLVYKNGGRIIIKGESLNRKEIRNYFGIDTKNTPDIIEQPISNNLKKGNITYIGDKLVGMMIYQEDGINNVTSIMGNKNDSEDEIEKALLHVSKHDYFGLALKEKQNNSSVLSMGPTEVYAENNTWDSVNVNTRSEYTSRLWIDTSLQLHKNNGNPNSSGQYLFASTYTVETEVRPTGTNGYYYCISNENLNSYGGSGSLIYEYGPTNQGGSSSTIQFTLPWAFSVYFDPQGYISISKTSGGINSNNVAMDFTPRNFLGFQDYDFDGLYLRNSYESYQTSTYFQTTGGYTIDTYLAIQRLPPQSGYDYSTKYSYGPSSTFTASGY
jgi:hypothetical protein